MLLATLKKLYLLGCPRHLIKMCPLLLFSKETRSFFLDTSQNSQVNYGFPCFSRTPKTLGKIFNY